MSDRHSRNGFLCSKGLEEAAQRFSLEGLAPRGVPEYIDNRVSVSASRRDEIRLAFDDELIDQQYRRFLSGS